MKKMPTQKCYDLKTKLAFVMNNYLCATQY